MYKVEREKSGRKEGGRDGCVEEAGEEDTDKKEQASQSKPTHMLM